MKFDPDLLQPGDTILYSPSDLIGVIIAVKTWAWISHAELYIGNGQSIGARIEGVNIYPLRNDKHSAYILRPTESFELAKALFWFGTHAQGDGYDVAGLFEFFGLSIPNSRHEFCSMLVAMVYNAGGFFPFNKDYPPRRISPAQFLQTPLMTTIWPDHPTYRFLKFFKGYRH